MFWALLQRNGETQKRAKYCGRASWINRVFMTWTATSLILWRDRCHIEGAEPGDVLKVTIISIDPGEYGYTFGSGGFIRDLMEGQFLAIWRLNKEFAVSDDLRGVRIPNGSFPGIVSTLPGPDPIASDTAPRTAARRRRRDK